MFTVGYSLMAMAYGGLIILLTQDRADTASLAFRGFFPLAGWSCGIYLWHWYLIRIFKGYHERIFQRIAAIDGGAIFPTLLQIGAFFVIALLVGMASVRFIEQPAARLFSVKKNNAR